MSGGLISKKCVGRFNARMLYTTGLRLGYRLCSYIRIARYLCGRGASLLRPGMRTGYCDRLVCLCVSVCVCLPVSISLEPLHRSSPNFVYRSLVAVARSSSGGVALRYVFPVLWLTSRLAVMTSRGRPERLLAVSVTGAESDVCECLFCCCDERLLTSMARRFRCPLKRNWQPVSAAALRSSSSSSSSRTAPGDKTTSRYSDAARHCLHSFSRFYTRL